MAVAAFMEKMILLNKHQIENRREFLKDVRFIELSSNFYGQSLQKDNIEFNDLIHFEQDFVDSLRLNFNPLKNDNYLKANQRNKGLS